MPLRVTTPPPAPVIVTVQLAPDSVRVLATPSAAVASTALTTDPARAFCRLASGGRVSSVKNTVALAEPRLSAWSVITAFRLLPPSAPRSAFNTLKSTLPAAMWASLSVTDFGVANEAPPSSSSSTSPATAFEPVVGRVTRKLVLTDSAAFMRPSARSLLPCSARVGAAGAVVSSVKASGRAAWPGLPAASVIAALRLFGPSRPSSEAVTVKSTRPWLTSAVPRMTTLGTANDVPPSSNSTWSPATALEPVLGSVTRKVVLAASAALMRSSLRSELPSSFTVGAEGATVSTWIG